MYKMFQTRIDEELDNKIEDLRWNLRLKKVEMAKLLIEKGLEKLSTEKTI